MYGVKSDLVICKFRHDTESPYWDQAPLKLWLLHIEYIVDHYMTGITGDFWTQPWGTIQKIPV